MPWVFWAVGQKRRLACSSLLPVVRTRVPGIDYTCAYRERVLPGTLITAVLLLSRRDAREKTEGKLRPTRAGQPNDVVIWRLPARTVAVAPWKSERFQLRSSCARTCFGRQAAVACCRCRCCCRYSVPAVAGVAVAVAAAAAAAGAAAALCNFSLSAH